MDASGEKGKLLEKSKSDWIFLVLVILLEL